MKPLHISENARRVLEARYLRRDARGRIAESPEDLFARVARAVAGAELRFGGPGAAARWEGRFRRLMTGGYFLPNSPTLMNAGTALGQLSACFVLPVPDTMEGIFGAVRDMALVQRTGGGTGFSFSRLRPAGDLVASTGGAASGPVSFMKIFDCATENIRQGGKRRGANMGVLRVDHPDVLAFVRAKLDGVSLQNFNLSVGVTDAFMEAAAAGRTYPLVHPRTGERVGRLDAAEVLAAMAEAAWACGDPGLLFLDAVARANPVPELGPIEATNPCGEVPLLPYESCNLGSLNLARLVRGDGTGARLDRRRLRRLAAEAVRFLDDVIEVCRYPLQPLAEAAAATRKIGLGVMGFAEMLVRMGISYDSDEAVAVAGDVARELAEAALAASRELARERGPYPAWRRGGPAGDVPVRNATRTAIAPTGTLGIIAGTSAGIEPFFALAYRRRALDGEILTEVNPLFEAAARAHGLDPRRLVEDVRRRGRLSAVPDVPETLRSRFVTALEVPPERHLAVQAAFQRHVDNSVSKTVNLPPAATPADVAAVFRRAWELGLKGITVYRYGSKAGQVLELGAGDAAFLADHTARCDPGECRL
ncbi:adenosylcobalamin-dependent ribonucleoside-diphosphate reductase [Dissulfurirhabdus thermomarina]|uniref:adenosylcobalamin-dependent ribonucleoside-diphosphate reductase n=1 Tax=Dissulfurirhabdus thermomarina TaxID=1765737 RepID=UPI002852E967|nr:adenosylcobalamin-dependent ribonucleoside-diphosphate reductase [Dissulfurirhabdus thermomarina]